MNNIAAEVTRLLCSLISTQLQQNLPRYLEVLKLQKEFEETCTSPGRYYICGGNNKTTTQKQNEKEEIIKAWVKIYEDKKIRNKSVMKSGLGLVGKHSL